MENASDRKILDRFEYQLIGFSVTKIQTSFVIDIHFEKDDFMIRLSTNLEWKLGKNIHNFDPEKMTEFDHEILKSLDSTEIRRVEISDTGSLTVSFSSGTEFRCPPDPDYEAWEVSGPGTQKIICQPSGRLAIWD